MRQEYESLIALALTNDPGRASVVINNDSISLTQYLEQSIYPK